MPTIKDKLYFNYDGVWSDTFGLLHINLDNGMFEENFVASRELNETKIRGSRKPALHSIEESPLEFDMAIGFEDTFSEEDIDEIVRWLYRDHYKPLYFLGSEDKVFYCTPISDSSIIHTGLNRGYFVIKMRCNSSTVYSPIITSTLETVTTTKTITITNNGHYDVYPEISIKKNGNGKVEIVSLDDGGSIFEVRNLTNLEDIYINCEKEIIQTDAVGIYRFNDVVGDYPRFIYGTNRMKITGACTIQFRYKKEYKT